MPEFTWIGWQRAPPWCRQVHALDSAATAHPWAQRDRRLFFAGGLDNGHHRKELRKLALAELAAGRTANLLIREVSSGFHRWKQFDRKQPAGLRKLIAANFSLLGPPLKQHAACSYQYSINVPGFGYSSRLRSLLRCGGTVVHVEHSSSEFFMPLLRHREHLYLLGGREPVRDSLLPLLHDLQSSPTRAAAVAAKGRAFAVHWLSFEGVVEYLRLLLGAYGELYVRGRRVSGAKPLSVDPSTEGFIRVDSELDLPAITGLCRCHQRGRRGGGPSDGEPRDPDHERACARESAAALRQRKPNQRCQLWAPPGGSRCFDSRCCVGWNCGVRALGCTGQATKP